MNIFKKIIKIFQKKLANMKNFTIVLNHFRIQNLKLPWPDHSNSPKAIVLMMILDYEY